MVDSSRMITLVSKDTDGHRLEYISVFTSIFTNRKHQVRLVRQGWRYAFSSNPLLFLMIEEGPLDFATTAFLRSFFFGRTVGLLFRPQECVVPRTLRLRIKRACLRVLRCLPRCSVVTILPFQTNSAFAPIARYGIYDPQLWDLNDLHAAILDDAQHGDLVAQIREKAHGRKVCVALGSQNSPERLPVLLRYLAAEFGCEEELSLRFRGARKRRPRSAGAELCASRRIGVRSAADGWRNDVAVCLR